MRILLQSNFTPPQKIELRNLTMEVLSSKHNEIDYEAWNSSKNSLKDIFGPRNPWPDNVSSLEQNLIDLENHFKEFKKKSIYLYSYLQGRSSMLGLSIYQAHKSL